MKKKYRILFVEDMPSDVELAKHELKHAGIEFESLCVETKKDFLEALKNYQPDIVLSDYSLPKFDGMTALKLTLEHAPTIPFILITGSMNEETAVECMKAGAVDYIIKQQIKRLPGALMSAVEQSHLREAKKRTDEQNQFLAYLVEKVNDAVISTDIDFNVVSWNRGAEKTYGWSAYEALNQPFDKLVKTMYVGTTRKEVIKHFFEFGFWKGEVVHHFKNGKPLAILSSVTMLRDNDKKPTGAVAINRDITERKRAEDALRRSEVLYRTLIETEPECVKVITKDNILKDMNPAGLAMIEANSLKQVVGKSFLGIIDPECRAAFTDLVQRVFRGESGILEFKITGLKGTKRLLETHAVPMSDEKGNIHSLLSVTRDITERKRAEVALQNSEEQLRTTLESTADGILAVDNNGKVVKTNRRFAEIWHIPQLLIESGDDNKLLNFVLDQLVEPEAFIKKVQSLYKSSEKDIDTLKFKDGRVFERYSSPMLLEKSIIGRVWSFRDITERKHAEEALQMSEEKYRQLFERNQSGVYRSTVDGKLLDCNERFVSMLGYTSVVELKSRPVQELYPLATDRQDFITRLKVNNYLENHECYLKRKDGTSICILESVVLMEENKGEPAIINGTCVDISERKRAEEALLASEERYRTIVENVNQAYYEADSRSLFTYCNPGLLIISGNTEEELLGKSSFRLVAEEHRDHVIKTYTRWRAEKRTDMSMEFLVVTKSQRKFWVEQNTHFEFNEKRDLIKATNFLRDIDERKRAEEALRVSEERYRSLFDRMMDGVYRSTHEGRFVEVNPALVKMFGFASKEEMLNVDIKKDLYFAPSERDSLFMDTGQERTEIFRMRHKDGSEIWVEDHGNYVHDEKGNVIFHEGILRDVTARLMAEDELRKSEEKYKDIFTWAPVGIYQSSVDGKIVTANKSLADMLGYDVVEDLINRDIANDVYYNKEERHKLIKEYDTKGQGSVTNLEILWKKKDGSPVWIMLTAHAIKDKSGKTIYYEGFVYDITEQKRAEENIRMLSRAMEQSPASVIITDLEGKIEYVNPKFTQATGYTSAEALGLNPRVLKSGETSDKEYKQLWEAITSGNEWRGEFHNKKKNGEFYWEYASISPIKDVSGKITHYLAVKEDITEKKMLEQQFFRTQRLESIGTLAGGIAHDLNNVLAPILLSVELLNRRHSDEATKQLLRSMESSALRGKDIIKQVLTFARGVEGHHVSIDVRHLVKEMDNIIMETFPKNIKKIINIPKDLLTIVGDATQVHQVLLNLCINARDAMPHGGTLSITASNIQIDAQYARMNMNARQGTYVLLNVADTGTGIPPEILGRIFEPFFTTKEVGKGTGLGLSTVYTIIKNHGGFLEVQSELGKGTTFKVHFPVVESVQSEKIQEEHTQPVSGKGELILVVDDEASVLDVTKQTLVMYGYNILTASDGTEAIALYAQHKNEIDLVISDILMPTLDGVMTARTLRRMKPDVKIILTSGHKQDESQSPQDDIKIDAFLQKPYTAEYLLKIVHDVLSTKK
jgi:PAS domain S-box-containing protein